jgi:hypothetical protein
MELAGALMNSSSSVYALQSATAAIEAGAGVALLSFPSDATKLLLGLPLDAPDALTVARIGGVALLTLAAAFWLGRGDAQSRASKGLIAAMVLYNLGAAVILAAAGVGSRRVGVALWPAVLLHAAMTAWCIATVRNLKRAEETEKHPSVAIVR